MLQNLYSRDRWSFTTPGFTNVLLTEPSNVKWVYTPKDESLFAYNLTDDPGELIWGGQNIVNFERESKRARKKIMNKIRTIRKKWNSGSS